MKLSAKERQELTAKYMKTKEGRVKLAAAFEQPLRNERDYKSIGRKTFYVEDVPDGAFPVYQKDPNITAYVVGEEGENILAVARSKNVLVPLFEIASNPEAHIAEVHAVRYNLPQRMMDKAASEINKEEDVRVFEILDASANTVNPDIPTTAPLTGDPIADAFALVEEHDLYVARIYMSSRDYSDIRKWGRDILDTESQGVLLKTGMQAVIWGAYVMTSPRVPRGYVYVCTEPKYFGRIPERIPLTIESADDNRARTIGFSCYENLGIGQTNPGGQSRIAITR